MERRRGQGLLLGLCESLSFVLCLLLCEGDGLSLGELLGGLDGGAVGADDLHAEEVACGVFLEAHHHGFEHLEGLFFVGDDRNLRRGSVRDTRSPISTARRARPAGTTTTTKRSRASRPR